MSVHQCHGRVLTRKRRKEERWVTNQRYENHENMKTMTNEIKQNSTTAKRRQSGRPAKKKGGNHPEADRSRMPFGLRHECCYSSWPWPGHPPASRCAPRSRDRGIGSGWTTVRCIYERGRRERKSESLKKSEQNDRPPPILVPLR
jgi:hypothetical protein